MSARKRAASESADAKHPKKKQGPDFKAAVEQAEREVAALTAARPKPKKKLIRKKALTLAEREVAALVAQGVPARQASRDWNLNPRNAGRLLQSPTFLEYLNALKRGIVKEDARRISEAAQITRTDIIGGLARLARINPTTTRGITGQVTAYMGLARIHGMLIDRNLNMDEFFRGWSEEELEIYAATGKLPHSVTAGESPSA